MTNKGPDATFGVQGQDTLPSSVTFVSANRSQGTCAEEPDIICELGTMGSGATATIDIVVKPTQAGVITNKASVSATTGDPAGANNSASVDTSICRITSRRSSIPCG